jgi:hypothetical protein
MRIGGYYSQAASRQPPGPRSWSLHVASYAVAGFRAELRAEFARSSRGVRAESALSSARSSARNARNGPARNGFARTPRGATRESARTYVQDGYGLASQLMFKIDDIR